MSVALDSSALVWMLRPEDPDDPLALRAATLRDQLEQATQPVIIPAPAALEFIGHYGTPEERKNASLTLEDIFMVAAFDRKAVATLAELRLDPLPGGQERDLLKIDWMIVATAISTGAQALYTADDDFEALETIAAGVQGFQVRRLPKPPPPDPQHEFAFEQGSPPS